jgi:mono/diheme cytochrome c family protein
MRQWPLVGLAALLLTACGGAGGGQVVHNPQLALGQEVYEANCAACHGKNGEGNGQDWRRPDANGIFAPPPHDDSGHTWHHPDGLLYDIIVNGGNAPKSAMPAFGETLSHDEIVATLEYIKTFWSAESRATQAQISQGQPYPTE